MKTSLLIPLAMLAGISVAGAQALSDETWGGLAGEGLKNAVAQSSRPDTYLSEILGPDGFWEVMRRADGCSAGYLNRFSAMPLPFAASPDSPPRSVYAFRLASSAWWEPLHTYGSALELDLYNIFPADEHVGAFVGSLVPSGVGVVTSEYGFLVSGTGYFGGGEHRCWQPPAGYEGDVARLIMYMVTLYPDRIVPFGQTTYSYFDGSSYPSLTDASARQLMAWHRADPVSDIEVKRNSVFALAQGNRNPFVDYPGVAEYLWGDKAGEPYMNPDESPAPQYEPLRARYSIADSRISLASPWVDSGAQWSVNGVPVAGDFLVPADLGTGFHTLRFRSQSESGAVVIEIY